MIQESLKKNILQDLKISQSKLNKLILNKRFYYFEELTQNQILKLFNINQSKIFSEINAKKHLNKILDMIKSNFINSKTSNYITLLLQPIFEKELYERRKIAFENLNKFEFEDDSNIKEILKNIDLLNEKIVFPNRIITFEQSISNYFYDKFKFSIETMTKQEFEEMLNYGEDLSDVCIISEEDLFCELDIFSKKEFEKIVYGLIIKNNSNQILNLIKLIEKVLFVKEETIKSASQFNIDLKFDLDFEKLKEILFLNKKSNLKEITNKTLRLEEEIEKINNELKEIISKKQLSLQGDELLNLLNSGSVEELQKKVQKDILEKINEKENEFFNFYREFKINIENIFEEKIYPLKIDEQVKDDILKQIEIREKSDEFEVFKKLSKFNFNSILKLFDFAFYFDFLYGISYFSKKFDLKFPLIALDTYLENGKNIYIKNPMPISYGIGTNKINLKKEKVSILTGANSGGKTTLLEMFLQAQILTSLGLGINANENSSIKLVEEVIYLKKFTGTQGSGAFEQTIRNLIEIISTNSSKLLLIDEFEAITEPGAAAKILINFLEEISNLDILCIGVSHLGVEIKEFLQKKKINSIRIDGISASGLDDKGNLITNHQPQFYTLGKSTPELILKRIINDEKFWINKSKEVQELLERIIE